MRNGSHCHTMTGNAGCVIAMPIPIIAVAAKKIVVVDASPRNAPPMAVISKPTSIARSAPSHPISAEPGRAPNASRIMGMPESAPISVPDMLRSVRMNGMTGGIARMGIRIATPASHSIDRIIISRLDVTKTTFV